MKGYPNNYYYEPYWKAFTGKAVGDWAKKKKLSCAGDFIVGLDFIATFSSWADSYYTHNKLIVWDKSCEKYHDLKKHCEEYLHTMFTGKTKEQFLREVSNFLALEEIDQR